MKKLFKTNFCHKLIENGTRKCLYCNGTGGIGAGKGVVGYRVCDVCHGRKTVPDLRLCGEPSGYGPNKMYCKKHAKELKKKK